MEYDNPKGIIAGAVLMQVMVVLCVSMRFYTRRWQKSQIMISDWLILAAATCGAGLTVIEIYGVSQKALAYPLNATLDDDAAVGARLLTAQHLEYSFILLGIISLGLIKVSATFLYWQLFAQVRFRRFLIIWIVVLIGWTVTFALAHVFQCGSHLTAMFGTPEEYEMWCGAAEPAGYGYVGSDIATDLITLIIPIPVIASLQLQMSRKLLVLATFMIGALSVGASIAKAYIYIKASLGVYNQDAILILTSISIWNLAEVQIGIIAASGPTLRLVLSQSVQTKSMRSLLGYIRDFRTTKRGTNDDPSLIKEGSSIKLSHRFGRSSKDLSHIESGHHKSMHQTVSVV